jgi:hypothetical protein
VYLRAIERQEPRQRAHDVGPLFVSQAGGFSVAWIRKSYMQSEVAIRSSVRSCRTFQLLVGERQHGIPRLHLRHGVLERHLAVAGEAREDHGKVLHERRVHHVAEIDDADDLVAARTPRAAGCRRGRRCARPARATQARRGRTSR